MADPPKNRRASGCDEPLDHKKRSESKVRWRERILEEVQQQILRPSNPNCQARAGGSDGGVSDKFNPPPPLIVLGDVQHLSLGLGSSQHPAVVGTDIHYRPQHTTYFSGTRNVSITGGLSRSVCHCRQGYVTANDPGSSSKPEGAGEGSITVVDGELHNTNIQFFRFFDGAHGNTFDGGAVMNAHEPATRTPTEGETAAPATQAFDGNEPTTIQLDPAVFQAAANPLTPIAPSIHSIHPRSSMLSDLPQEPPVRLNNHVSSSHPDISLSPLDCLVTPSPYRQRWEHGHSYSYDAVANDRSDGARPSSDRVGRHRYPFDLGDYSGSPPPPPPPPCQADGEGYGEPSGRMRTSGSSWLLRKFKKMKKKSDASEVAVKRNEETEW